MSIGSKYLAADGAVGTSGSPVKVYSITFLSGATAGVAVLRNASASGTVYVQQTAATVSATHTTNFEGGMLFPDGCFFDKGTNVTSIVVSYTQMLS